MLKRYQETAAERGGVCLSPSYAGYKVKLLWRCARGHEFELFAHLVAKGKWCPVCTPHSKERLAARKRGLAAMQALAVKRGGACESTTYISQLHTLEWRCAAGHRWQLPGGSVLRGAWCPYCSGRRRSLDEPQALIAEIGGTCLSTAYVGPDAPLRWRCAHGHEWLASLIRMRRVVRCPYCSPFPPYDVEELQALARGRGGTCEVHHCPRTGNLKLLWRCRTGHRWYIAPSVIRGGSWCPTCLWHAQALARRFGGECLASRCVDVITPLTWQCAAGHTWSATQSEVARGRWCAACGLDGASGEMWGAMRRGRKRSGAASRAGSPRLTPPARP